MCPFIFPNEKSHEGTLSDGLFKLSYLQKMAHNVEKQLITSFKIARMPNKECFNRAIGCAVFVPSHACLYHM